MWKLRNALKVNCSKTVFKVKSMFRFELYGPWRFRIRLGREMVSIGKSIFHFAFRSSTAENFILVLFLITYPASADCLLEVLGCSGGTVISFDILFSSLFSSSVLLVC